MYWKDYSFYCVPSVNKKADRSWMAYGQRGHTGCNHSPSSGEGNPESATTPSESQWWRLSPGAPHGLLFIHHPWFAPAGTSGRLPWETVAKDMPCCLYSQEKGESQPFWQFPESSTERGHWSLPLITVSVSFRRLGDVPRVPYVGAARGSSVAGCNSTCHSFFV